MSRFFETLKEVSRSQLLPSEPLPDSRPEEKSAPGPDRIQVPDLANFPVSAAALPEAPALTEIPLERQDRRDRSASPEPGGFRETTIDTKLDRKIPLIPHTLDNSVVEQYRRLRTKIQQQHAKQPIHSLLVASPGQGEGKTVTTFNLALSFAMLPSTRVLIVDGDLRRGTVSKWLNVRDMPGISNVLEGSACLEDTIFKTEDLPMHFLFGGTSTKSPAELLNSAMLPQVMRRLCENFDLVLVDSPPVNLIADAQMLAGSCDGVLLVARAFKTTNKAFQKMMRDLLPFRIVGTVLNGGMRTPLYSRYYNY